jgi:AmiR/NasT family two-component response regulator
VFTFRTKVEPDLLVQPAMNRTRVLLVENEPAIARDLDGRLRRLGYDVAGRVDSGEAAIRGIKDCRPHVVLMDVEIAGKLPGPDAAQHIQKTLKLPVIYLSANSSDATISRARETGPFGFLLTPFDQGELKVAIEMAVYRHRMVMEHEDLIHQLQDALAQVKALSGLLPICAECKKVRDDGGYWNKVELYIEQRTDARFSHGLCPDCYQKAIAHHYEELTKKRRRKRGGATSRA